MKLLVSALEPSSNIHLEHMLRHTDEVEMVGIFDASLGMPLYSPSDFSIMGFVDALKKIIWLRKVLKEMLKLAEDVDKVLLMDGSGFNLPLAKQIKKHYPDKEIIYYILPQVWASRPKRAKRLEKYCDTLLAILPFESRYYSAGRVRYVGHPLLDKGMKKYTPSDNTIVFLPGSRRSEVKKLLPVYRKVRIMLGDKRALLVIPKHLTHKEIRHRYGDISMFEIVKDTQQALSCAEFAFVCSGTATLEAALMGIPFVLVYIARKIDYAIAKKMLSIEHIGLANIILAHAGEGLVHQELLQEQVTAENLVAAYSTADRNLFSAKSNILRDILGQGSSQVVAPIIMAK